MAAWPVALEQCPILGWNERPLDNIIQFETEVGPPKRRRRTSNAGSILSMQFKMDVADYTTFLNFYRNTIADGALTFTHKHPLTQAAITVSFEEPPAIAQEAPKQFVLSCNWRVWP